MAGGNKSVKWEKCGAALVAAMGWVSTRSSGPKDDPFRFTHKKPDSKVTELDLRDVIQSEKE